MWFARQAPRLVSLRQHRMFEAAGATELGLAQSTQFLRAELPVRLHALRSMAGALPADCAQLPSATAWDQALHAHCARYAEPPADVSATVELVEAALLQAEAGEIVEEVNLRLQHLGADMQLWLAAGGGVSSSGAAGEAERWVTNRRIDAFFSRE